MSMRLPNSSDPQRRVDGLSLIVRQIDSPYTDVEGSTATAGFMCEWQGLDVPLDEAGRLTTAVAWDDSRGEFSPFTAKESWSRYSWGADASSVNFLVEVGQNVAANLVVAGMAYAIGHIRGGKAEPTEWTPSDDELTRETAVRTVSEVFGERYEEVQVSQARVKGDTVRLKLKGRRGKYVSMVGRLSSGDVYCHAQKR